ncbi:LOW QUALITY PROTEIN: pericentrin [Neosynchiropus ocellatus]
MDEDERQRKLEAGRAKKPSSMPRTGSLASFRQKRAKGDGAGSTKKTAKRKSKNVPQNDGAPQVCGVAAPLSSAADTELETNTNQEELHSGSDQNLAQKAPPPSRRDNLSAVQDLGDEELVTLTGKEQLKLLQEAVEKRNEIISKLSANLPEALASRDQVQLEPQSMAGEIQGLQTQLQQTSAEFLRIKSQAGNDVSNVGLQLFSHGLPNGGPADKNTSPEGSDCAETDSLLKELETKLQMEQQNNQQLCAELEHEKASHQRVLSQLREEKTRWQEQGKERELQLAELQTQCLEMLRYKKEKEKLNQEVLELRTRLQEEEDEAERRFREEHSSYLSSLQKLEEEMKIVIENHRAEMEQVQLLLVEKERELKHREDEVVELKDFKNKHNQVTAGLAPEEERRLRCTPDEDNMNALIPGDLLMERYLPRAPFAHSPSSLASEGSDQCSQLDVSNFSFELNSEVLGDSRLEDVGFLRSSPSIPTEEKSNGLSQWVVDSVSDKQEMSQLSEQPLQELDLEKELLNQQCAELRQEIAVKDEQLAALGDEVRRVTEELGAARSRCVRVEDGLKQVGLQQEQEKSKRNCAKQLEPLKTDDDDDDEELNTNHVGVLGEGNQKDACSPSPEDVLAEARTLKDCCGDLKSQLEETTENYGTTMALLNQRTVELDTALKDLDTARDQLLKIQTEMEGLQKRLEESQKSLSSAEELKQEVESKIVCLSQSLTKLEEEQAQAVLEREESIRKGEETDERIRKMEQVLEDELEQFETLLKAKEDEFAEEREKWEVEKQEKNQELLDVRHILEQQKMEMEQEVKTLLDKQALAVEKATAELCQSHQQEVDVLVEKQQHEISELNQWMEKELQQQKAAMEAEQKKQISLIKQVTEREHERMTSELVTKHAEELVRLRSELSQELEAAHQAELQQAQDQKLLDLEELRRRLTIERVEHQNGLAKAQEELASTKALLYQARKAQNDAQQASSQTESELSARLERIQKDCDQKILGMEVELKRAWADRDVAAASLEELVSSHLAALQERQQQVLHLEEKEHQLQQEVLRLQHDRDSLKKSSEKEVGQLWTQLESMRASRQELGELKEQLLARSSRVEDIERLKAEFSEQKREIKEQNEAELESLRRYFEQRLQAAEENHREEIALLQLKLVEGALEESVLRTSDHSSISGGPVEQERDDSLSENTVKPDQQEGLDSVRVQLETSHKLALESVQASMAVSFSEELNQMRSDLTDHYYKDLQELKSRHALDLEQLRARLSDLHLQEITQLRLDAARHVELEVEQRTWSFSEELQSKVAIVHSFEESLAALRTQQERALTDVEEKFSEELVQLTDAKERHEEERRQLEEQLNSKREAELADLRRCLEQAVEEERERLQNLQAGLDSSEGPQVKKLRQKLGESSPGSHDRCMVTKIKELTVRLQEQAEERLLLIRKRFQAEKALLEQCLSQKCDASLAELRSEHRAEMEQLKAALLEQHTGEKASLEDRHKAGLDSLGASHREQLSATVAQLECKHNSQLVSLEAALQSKRKKDLENLEAAFQETSRAQLEVLESELSGRHQEEKDELEKRMLANMDTLEATYLKEVQTLRDEIVQREEKHCQDLQSQQTEHQKAMERHLEEQAAIREELRKELAQLHMEKFRAMAAELSQVHKTELLAQKESLDVEHCNALGVLKKQVLELEQQHGAALQELSLAFAAEKQQAIDEHQLQLQELRSVSARELEACRRELEEESSRQRQRFLEEVELLKAQSEEQMQDRIKHLKNTLEEKKEAELVDLRRSFAAEQEEKERHYTEKMSQLTAQLQQLDAVVTQLRAEVGCLQGELEGKRAEMETLDTLLQRRERESQEGGNHLKLLTDDLQAAKEERHQLHQANGHLTSVVLEMVRSIAALEDLIGRKISERGTTSDLAANHCGPAGSKDPHESGISVAEMTTEDFEFTTVLSESMVVSDAQVCPGTEREMALTACRRLQLTVDTLLELLNRANAQLERTHDVHLSLEEKFSQGREDTAQLVEQHKLLLEQMDEDAQEKNKLELKLHKTEGLLEGYVAEKAILEETLLQKEAQEERLVEELEDLRVQVRQVQGLSAELDVLRVEHQALSEEHTVLLRQKEHLSADLGDREKALLAETERLTLDRLDLQRQAEKDHASLSVRLRALELELEEQETKGLEAELHHKTQTEDLNHHVQALEKQLKHDRQFIEEQAVEREHERDEFQQEIRRLEADLRQTAGVDNKAHRFEDLVLQVESLQAVIKDKAEDHAALAAANQQAQRDLAERNEEIDKLAGRIRELEQALLNSAESHRAAGQLEQKLNKARMREQELTQDKQALEQQQLANRLQISALQSKLDETRHCYQDNTQDPTLELRDALDSAQQSLQSKEQQAEVLTSQLENLQSDLSIKEVELKHLTLQLELLTNQSAARVDELQEEIAALKENVSALTDLVEEKREQRRLEDSFPSALLEEKNQEIDHLTLEVQRLEQELENARDSKALESELADLSSQVEHLTSEVTRVRQDKQEEEERLHEVISTLQAELATLGPNLHEVSDSQDGDSINPSPSPSPEPHSYITQDQAGRAGPNNLKQELSLTNAVPSRSLRSRMKTLQAQLETAAAEREGLERLLLTQEEEYRVQGEELGASLRAERGKVVELQNILSLKEAELETARRQLEAEQRRREEGEEEQELHRNQAQRASILREENEKLNSLLLELQHSEPLRLQEVDALKTRLQEARSEAQVLRESCLTLEGQVQKLRAEVADMEQLLAQERLASQATVKAELSAEREVLRRREGQLHEEMERRRKEVTSLKAQVDCLTGKLSEKETSQEDHRELLEHAERAREEAAEDLRLKEKELSRLASEHQALQAELTVVKEQWVAAAELADRLQDESHRKDCELADVKTHNQRLKRELARQDDPLASQQFRLPFTSPHHPESPQKDASRHSFRDVFCDGTSLNSPEVLRKMDMSADRLLAPSHSLMLVSRLSELYSVGPDPPSVHNSSRVVLESPRSRTITPDPETQSTHSPRSMSDHYSALDSLDADKVTDIGDLTTPTSPLGSTSSLSAPEWASDGYGSNVSSELGARLRVELEQTERLDAQFVEYLRCRGMNPAANTDSAAGSMSYSDDLLSLELQALLKKVYQESCRILTLSQRRATPAHLLVSDARSLSAAHGQQQAEGCPGAPAHLGDSGDVPPMTWQQEKRALQETVIALRELLCRMAQRHTESDSRVDGDRNRELLAGELPVSTELEESQKLLQCAQDVQQEQRSEIQTLRSTIEEGQRALSSEQTRVHELELQLEQERAESHRREREAEHLREATRDSCEQQRSEVMALKGQVEQEKVACSNLRRELQIEQSRTVLFEKRLGETQKELQEGRELWAHQQELHQQKTTHLEALLSNSESQVSELHAKLADTLRSLEEERERCLRLLDEMNQRAAETAGDRRFISDVQAQLEQARRQAEELAAENSLVREELVLCKRNLEAVETSEAKGRRTISALKEQGQEFSRALEAERERTGNLRGELEEQVRAMKDKEKEWDKDRRRCWQEETERERRQERMNNKLCQLEMLRQQDQQRMQELQHTLEELEKDAQRTSPASRPLPEVPGGGSMSSCALLDSLLKENSELSERVRALSQEKAASKHKLHLLERQLRRAEGALAKVSMETENIPVSDATTHVKMQRFYERYLRAESFRKALVYQKRYLLLLLGGFQQCEQATLSVIAKMGARPSTPVASRRRPLGRFRATVLVVVAISRMKFLTRKWLRAIRKVSAPGVMNGHASGSKADVLGHQKVRCSAESPPSRNAVSALVPPSKSPFRLHNSWSSPVAAGSAQDPEKSLTDYIRHLERVQLRLSGSGQESACPSPRTRVRETRLAPPANADRRIQSACSPDMIGYRQRWLQENRTWLYLSCLSPLYLYGPGESFSVPVRAKEVRALTSPALVPAPDALTSG